MMSLSDLRSYVVFFSIAVLLGPSTGSAKDASEEYAAHLARIDTTIKEGDYSSGMRKARKFEREMLDSIVGGPMVPEYLGEIAKLYAVALAGVGEMEHAAWKWHMAGGFSPDLEESVLADYGEAGERLRQYLEREAEEFKKESDYGGVVSPPQVKKNPAPRYPRAQTMLDLQCSLLVEVVIDVDGVPYLPTILKSAGRPTLVYTTLDALRKWRFEPARVDGDPVPAYYVLNSRFHPH